MVAAGSTSAHTARGVVGVALLDGAHGGGGGALEGGGVGVYGGVELDEGDGGEVLEVGEGGVDGAVDGGAGGVEEGAGDVVVDAAAVGGVGAGEVEQGGHEQRGQQGLGQGDERGGQRHQLHDQVQQRGQHPVRRPVGAQHRRGHVVAPVVRVARVPVVLVLGQLQRLVRLPRRVHHAHRQHQRVQREPDERQRGQPRHQQRRPVRQHVRVPHDGVGGDRRPDVHGRLLRRGGRAAARGSKVWHGAAGDDAARC